MEYKMQQDFEICKFSDKEEKIYYEVMIEGKLIRGWGLDTDPDLLGFIDIVKVKSVKKLIIINLSNMSFWDTQGIQLIVEAVANINKKMVKRAGIVGGGNSLNEDVAREKYKKEFSSGLVPWKDTVQDLITELRS